MNNVLLYLGGLLVLVLTALFAVPVFIDWNGYRGVFEEEASKVLGRDVRVGGAVAVRFLPTPYVRFEKVRLADPTGQTGESFVRAESFTMWLSGPALLRGVLEANQVELNKPTLTLALDGKGSGNWASLQLKPGALPFVPKDVTLKSVKLIDGTLSLYNPDAQMVGKVEAVNGELAADALNGPFKFKGTVSWAGEPREIKLVTDQPAQDGSFRIKANSKSLKDGTSYTLDGRVDALSSTPKFAGELTAKLLAPRGDDAPPPADQGGMDFKSTIAADTMGAKFDDVSLTLDNTAAPQVIVGHATSNWAGEPRLDVVLTSKWLDLDRIAGGGQDTVSFPRIKHLVMSLIHSLAGNGAATAQIDVEQIKMGGESAGGLKVDTERRGGDFHIRQFAAGLPGGSRLSVSGDVKDDAGKMTFTGMGSVHGTNVARLLSWAGKSGADIDLKGEGPFSAAGQIVLSDNRFELRDATAELNGRPISGDVALIDEPARRISVSLESARIDTSEFFPGTVHQLEAQIREAFGLSQPAGAANANTNTNTSTAAGSAPEGKESTPGGDIELKLLTSELKHGNRIYRNVDARLALSGGNLRVTRANFTSDAGLVVGIEGQVLKAENASRGTLAYELDAKTPAAAQDVASVFGLSAIISPERLAALGPGQIAGLVHLGKRGETAADISVDGTLNSAQVSGQAIFESGFGAWNTAPSSATFKIKAQDPGVITGLIGIPMKAAADAEPRPAEVVIASSGPLAGGAAALVAIKAPGLDAGFNGRATWPAGGAIALSGPLTVKSRDVQELAALAGIKLPAGTGGTAVEGQIDVAVEKSTWAVSSRQLAVGNSTLSGAVTLKPATDTGATISGAINADRVTVAALLSGILDKPAAPVAGDAAAAPAATAAPVWPEAIFNFNSLKGVTGALDVKFAELDVGGALAVRDGALKIGIEPDKVLLSNVAGRALGGAVDASARFQQVAGGVTLQTTVKISRADLAQLSSRASGRAAAEVTAECRAQSPAGLIAALTGSGTIGLEGATIAGPAPKTVTVAANTVLQNKTSNNPDAIQQAVEASLAVSSAPLGTRKVGFTIADGTIKVEPVALETPDGKATVTATADLMTLRLDSIWQVSALVTPLPPPTDVGHDWVAPAPKGPLPPASIAYTGRLDDPKTLVAKVDTGELQRELTVRQMERNVEELERLRKRDEESARREVERRKAIEAEKAAAKALLQAKPAAQPPLPPPDPGAQPMPPVLPDSNGSNSAAPGPAAPQAQAAQGAPSPPATVVPLTVEPIDPPATAEVVPPVAPRLTPPRPQPAKRPAEPRRTTSEEVLRSLGAVP